jgi:predicted site-specific integrase-resolvase
VNLKEWAAAQGVSYVTARRWFAAATLPVPARKVGGLILVGEPAHPLSAGVVAVYARLSSSDQCGDRDRQVARVTTWATGQGMAMDRVVTEVGLALNGHRRRFLALLGDPAVFTILVEHRDRFARFGAAYVEAALSAQGRRLLVVDPAEVDPADDLRHPRRPAERRAVDPAQPAQAVEPGQE